MTFTQFTAEVHPLIGQIGLLYSSTPVVILGAAFDHTDHYYIVQEDKRGSQPYWASAVGHLDGLKEHLPEEMYTRMAKHFEFQLGITLDDIVPEIVEEDENGNRTHYTFQHGDLVPPQL